MITERIRTQPTVMHGSSGALRAVDVVHGDHVPQNGDLESFQPYIFIRRWSSGNRETHIILMDYFSRIRRCRVSNDPQKDLLSSSVETRMREQIITRRG